MLNDEVELHVNRRFELLEKIGSGAYGTVWKARNRSSDSLVALKKIYEAFDNSTDAQRTLREVLILRSLQDHPHINHLIEVIRAENNRDLYLVLEFVHSDLATVCMVKELKYEHAVHIMYQLFTALKFLHSGAIIHRDLKPSNVLISYLGEVKLCDFGLARPMNVPESLEDIAMTEKVAIRWYRAPELLFNRATYDYAVDVWSAGCIFAELLCGKPLFQGSDNQDQISRIFCALRPIPVEEVERVTGSSLGNLRRFSNSTHPRLRELLPKSLPDEGFDFLLCCLRFDPRSRITASEALEHEIFRQIRCFDIETTMKGPVVFPPQAFQRLSVSSYQSVIYSVIDPLWATLDKPHRVTPKTDNSETWQSTASRSNAPNRLQTSNETNLPISGAKKKANVHAILKAKILESGAGKPRAAKDAVHNYKQSLLDKFLSKEHSTSLKRVPEIKVDHSLTTLKELHTTQPSALHSEELKKVSSTDPMVLLKIAQARLKNKSKVDVPQLELATLPMQPKYNFLKAKADPKKPFLSKLAANLCLPKSATLPPANESKKKNPTLKVPSSTNIPMGNRLSVKTAAEKGGSHSVSLKSKPPFPALAAKLSATITSKSQLENPCKSTLIGSKSQTDTVAPGPTRSSLKNEKLVQLNNIVLKFTQTQLMAKKHLEKSTHPSH